MIRRLLMLFALLAICVVPAHAQNFDRQVIRLWGGSSSVDTTAVGMADSSNVIWTRGAARMVLTLKPNIPCRVAILVKTYGDSLSETILDATGSDSTKVAVWPWTCPTYANGDTLLFKLQANTNGTSVAPSSWEYTIEFPNADPVSNRKWGVPRQLNINLYRPCDNTWCTADKVAIRYRILTASGVVTMAGTLKTYTW